MSVTQTADSSIASPAEAVQPMPSTAAQPLRSRLFMMAASGLLPLVLAAVVGTAFLIHDRSLAAQRSAMELSRALATAVDAELKSTVAVLEALALSDELINAQPVQWHALAKRVAQQRGWRAVLLADASGRILMRSNRAVGDSLPEQPIEQGSMQLATSSRAPVVGPVTQGKLPGSAFAVRVPVVRDGQLVNIVSAVVDANQILNVLTRQNVPATWVVAIFDQSNARVARTKFNPMARPSPSMQALMDTGAREGMGLTSTLEGVSSFSGFSRLPDSGWTAAVGIAASEVYLGLLPLLLALGVGLLASLALSAYLAWVYGQRVSKPIGALKTAAAALGRGDRVSVPALGVLELDEVGEALSQASAEREATQAERRKSEAEREELLQRVTQALCIAEEAGRSKDEFLAVLGHELRNPLAPITTALHLIERKGDDRTRREREILSRQLKHMVRLVDDLLDVSRINTKRLMFPLEPLRPASVIDSAALAVQALMGERSFQVRIDPAAGCAWVRGDEVRLTQVMNNVIGNAVKFTMPKGRIDLAVFLEGDVLQIEVRDDGVGMTTAVVERAFDAFYQAPQEIDRARGGLGLGLAIVKSLIEMHGGSASLASDGPGRGTTVTLRLPCIEAPPSQLVSGPSDVRAGKGKVLVVDDNRDAADSIGELLEMAGYEVRVVHHPDTALEQMAPFCPDAAVLDIGLPGMSGYELAAALRAPPYRFEGFMLALTGYGEQKDVAQAMSCGFDAHVTKPVDPQKFLDVIASCIKPASVDLH